MDRPAVNGGNANSIIVAVASMPQVNIGIRSMLMPGAREVRIVAMMFTAARMDPIPVISSPAIHRSIPAPGGESLLAQGWVRGPAGVTSPADGQKATEDDQAPEQE